MTVKRTPRARERSGARITKRDLAKLSKIALADREDLFLRKPHLRQYRRRIVCVALCQEAALHYLNRGRGVKDFDVWTFYAAKGTAYPHRRRGKRDFGISKFGRRPKDNPRRFLGRRVDLLGRSLPVRPNADHPFDVIERYLGEPRTKTAKMLAKKAVVIIDPEHLRGQVAWDPDWWS